MIPKLKLNLENWKPELRENLKKTLDINIIINGNKDLIAHKINTNCYIQCYYGCENVTAILDEYGYADTEAAIEKYLKQYMDDLEHNYLIEVGLMRKDYEKYYKCGSYINADGVDTGEDFYDLYNTDNEPKTDYENSWITVAVYELVEHNK